MDVGGTFKNGFFRLRGHNTTLAGFLEKIEKQYGRSDRVWIMDRGIPTEATLATMREGDAPVHYLVGTPKGRLTKLEKSFLGQPWQAVRPCVEVKLLAEPCHPPNLPSARRADRGAYLRLFPRL